MIDAIAAHLHTSYFVMAGVFTVGAVIVDTRAQRRWEPVEADSSETAELGQ